MGTLYLGEDYPVDHRVLSGGDQRTKDISKTFNVW